METFANLFWLMLYGCIAWGAVRLMWKALAGSVKAVQTYAENEADIRDQYRRWERNGRR
jgi:hypothetical protein